MEGKSRKITEGTRKCYNVRSFIINDMSLAGNEGVQYFSHCNGSRHAHEKCHVQSETFRNSS
jgi:hypothetical protein